MRQKQIVLLAAGLLAVAAARADFPAFPICSDPAAQQEPSVNGSLVVWSDYRNGNWDIYGCDLSTGTEFPICVHGAEQSRPAVSGQTVVWRDYRNGNWDVYGATIDLSDPAHITVAEMPILTGPDSQVCSGIHLNRIAVELHRVGEMDGEYMAYDLDSGVLVESTDDYDQGRVAISGDLLIWEDWRNDPGDGSDVDVYGYDLVHRREFVVCADGIKPRQPDVLANLAAWADHREKLWHIYIALVDTSDPNIISVHVSPLGSGKSWGGMHLPRVGQEVVVTFVEGDPDKDSLYGFELLSGGAFPISRGSATDGGHDISGDLVVWTDTRSGNPDIYGAIIPEPTALALAAAGGPVLVLRRRRRGRASRPAPDA